MPKFSDIPVVNFTDKTGLLKDVEISLETMYKFGEDSIDISLYLHEKNADAELAQIEFKECLPVNLVPEMQISLRELLVDAEDINNLLSHVLAANAMLEISKMDNCLEFTMEISGFELVAIVEYNMTTQKFGKQISI